MPTITLTSDNPYLAIHQLNHMKTQEIVNKISAFKKLSPLFASKEELIRKLHDAVPTYLLFHKSIENSRGEFYRIRKDKNPPSPCTTIFGVHPQIKSL